MAVRCVCSGDRVRAFSGAGASAGGPHRNMYSEPEYCRRDLVHTCDLSQHACVIDR